MYTVADLRLFLFSRCFEETDHAMDNLIYDFKEDEFKDKVKSCEIGIGGWCAHINYIEEGVDDIIRLKHYFQVYEKLSVREGTSECTTTLNKECNTILVKFIGKPKKSSLKYRGMAWYSCSPDNRIGISEGECMKMKAFCEKVFTEKWFIDAKWILESGKHKKNPNLHFHALVRFKDESASKNWRSRCLLEVWNEMYPNNQLDWIKEKKTTTGKLKMKKGIDVKHCNTAKIQEDKYNYCNNDSKGSHKNFTDLGIGNEFGDVLKELKQ